MRGQGGSRGKGSKGERGYVILGFRVSTSIRARGEGQKGVKGSKVYCILGFREQRRQWEQRG